jgi:hypothetical protein
MNPSEHFTSSILRWMRTDQPRQAGMDSWKGPHSGIITAGPGLEEYRQIHLAEANPGSSGERLMTPLEITQSTAPSSIGLSSM